MEKNRLSELVEESIQLELNISELYQIFADSIPEDSEFWWQLHLEEKSHATLIRAARDSFIKRGKFPYDLIADSIDELKLSNTKIEDQMAKFKANPPSRQRACETAIELENEAGEIHYMQFMEKVAENPVQSVFQQLNRDDKQHECRIRALLETISVEA